MSDLEELLGLGPAELLIVRSLTPHARLHVLCLMAAHRGATLTSGRRTPERNRAVGGVARSLHLSGRAVDLHWGRESRAAVLATARAQRVSVGCTGPEEALDEGDHLHLAW